jgi:hypothetical protein
MKSVRNSAQLAATAALVVAGTGASTLWFLSVLRRLGLRLRFAPA